MSKVSKIIVYKNLRWMVLSLLVGILSGVSAAIFLRLLNIATNFREAHSAVIWLLPLSGLFIGWVYYSVGKDVAAGNNLILEEIHDPKKVVPIRMAPMIFLGSVLSHLFGASAGREGAAVQMGASLSDQLSKYFKVESEERKILLVCGAGAGFSAAIGAPLAGIVFGMEVVRVGRIKFIGFFECFLASFVAYWVSVLLSAPHSEYPPIVYPDFSFVTMLWVALCGILFGIVAMSFSKMVHLIERIQSKWISFPPFKPAIAGLLLVLFYYLEGSYRYVGLGIPYIQEALQLPAKFLDPLYKSVFSAITVGSGFKGGEFIPLVFVGTTLGSALSIFIPVSFQLLGVVGFASVFAGASNTPLACSLMVSELFGFRIFPYALVACYMSYLFSGHKGIYSAQKVHRPKHKTAMELLDLLGEFPKRFLPKKK